MLQGLSRDPRSCILHLLATLSTTHSQLATKNTLMNGAFKSGDGQNKKEEVEETEKRASCNCKVTLNEADCTRSITTQGRRTERSCLVRAAKVLSCSEENANSARTSH